jgi:hypothetical protein
MKLLDCLLILFIALKLCTVITWPWFWVLAPLWIPALFFSSAWLIAEILKVKSSK